MDIPATTRADLTLTALRIMRGAHKRPQNRGPGTAWTAMVDRWIEQVEPAKAECAA